MYSGKSSKSRTFALIYDHTAGSFILEQIDTQFAFTADENALDSEDRSDAAILSALIEKEGEPEEDNPFDFRHQLQRARSPTPELEQFRLDTGATPSPAPSPAPRPVKPRQARRASSPPGMNIDFEDDPPSPERYAGPI